MKKIVFVFAILISIVTVTNAQSDWQQANGPYGGHVRSLAINSAGNIFTGTFNGIFKSTDGGEHWNKLSSGLTHTYVNRLSINSIGHIFAGTFDEGYFVQPIMERVGFKRMMDFLFKHLMC
jgi:hypothetical protein